MPFVEVITLYVPVTHVATNKLISGDQHKPHHVSAWACVRAVQLMPSGEDAPAVPTAVNMLSVGDHAIFLYDPAGIVLAVHDVPFVDVAHTLSPTATNNASSADQHTAL